MGQLHAASFKAVSNFRPGYKADQGEGPLPQDRSRGGRVLITSIISFHLTAIQLSGSVGSIWGAFGTYAPFFLFPPQFA